jgi:predicted CopG family antitoxin
MTYKNLKMIAVSEENYLALKKLGSAGDSFNDVVTEVLKQVEKIDENKLSRTIPGFAARDKSLIDTCIETSRGPESSHE